MNLYSANIPIWATVYIKAPTKKEAKILLARLQEQALEVEGAGRNIPISGRSFDDPRLPVISLSPAMMIDLHIGEPVQVELCETDVPETVPED